MIQEGKLQLIVPAINPQHLVTRDVVADIILGLPSPEQGEARAELKLVSILRFSGRRLIISIN